MEMKMKIFLPISRYVLIAVCTFAAVSFSSTASADVETARVNLKSCVTKHLASEKAMQSPKADRLLEKCKSDHDQLLSTLPPELSL
jgi:NaMN:DMB phosphoribosyltransferase